MNLREDQGGFLVDIVVMPRASRVRVGPVRQDRLVVAVTAPPVDGEANRAVVDALSRAAGVARGNVEIVSQLVSRNFTFFLSIADNDRVSFIFDHAKPPARKKGDYAIFGRRRDVLNRIQHARRSQTVLLRSRAGGTSRFWRLLRSNWRSSRCWNVFLDGRTRNFWELSSHPNEAAAK